MTIPLPVNTFQDISVSYVMRLWEKMMRFWGRTRILKRATISTSVTSFMTHFMLKILSFVLYYKLVIKYPRLRLPNPGLFCLVDARLQNTRYPIPTMVPVTLSKHSKMWAFSAPWWSCLNLTYRSYGKG